MPTIESAPYNLLILTVDDVVSGGELAASQQADDIFPVHVSLLVAGSPRFEQFIKQHRNALTELRPGLHLNLVDGEDFQDSDLLGSQGTVAHMLKEREAGIGTSTLTVVEIKRL